MFIAKSKLDKYRIPDISLDLEAFREVVNSDDELVWFDDTSLGKEYYEQFTNDKRYESAFFDFNKKNGWSNEMFKYGNVHNKGGYISIQVSRMTCKRLDKILEVTTKLDAFLLEGYGDKIVTEKKIAKLREKFCKEK